MVYYFFVAVVHHLRLRGVAIFFIEEWKARHDEVEAVRVVAADEGEQRYKYGKFEVRGKGNAWYIYQWRNFERFAKGAHLFCPVAYLFGGGFGMVF